MVTSTVEESISRYVQAWNQTSADAIKEVLKDSWTPQTRFIDPKHDPVVGIDGLAAAIEASQQAMPGRSIAQTSKVDFHHGSGRYEWLLTQVSGTTTEGMTCFDYNEAGQLTRVVAFFGVL